MSTARHHAEWLSLLEISGPFLALPVLLRAFPQGLEAHEPEALRAVRAGYAEWADDASPATHAAWVRFVLERLLEWPTAHLLEGQAIPGGLKAVIAEQAETLRPTLVLVEPGTVDKARVLVQVYPRTQDLDKVVPQTRWKASPATRMMELLHATEVRLGIVTNGERWMLVDAPRGGTTGFISWYAEVWQDEPLTLRAWRTLLGARRLFGVAEGETLEALLAASAADQHEVTDQLGYQVRRAVEVFIQAVDRADVDAGHTLLTGVSEATLYEAALTVMMRLVFLFSAEERGLLLLGDPLYDQGYAVSTLRAQLREVADKFGEELLERRYDAWGRLLATFRAVHGGAWHENLRLPAYGGSLFDPERFAFLEGREKGSTADGRPSSGFLPINNRVTLHLLEALQILRVKVPGGGPAEARRLSFRALDIEQIGHVYESLLDHTAKRAHGVLLGLIGTKDKEPEVVLADLEAYAAPPLNHQSLIANSKFLDFLRETTGRSDSALKRALSATDFDPHWLNRLRVACGNDEALFARVLPFAGLLRADEFDYPTVILPGSVYVTAGTDRRATGTHYTPKSLTEPIVQRTLEPLVYVGPAEGLPRDQWQLRPPAELLQLKICDMAMGSGAFLVQVCRYLSERVVEAWEGAEKAVNSKQLAVNGEAPTVHRSLFTQKRLQITPDGAPATGAPDEQLIPDNADERLAFARRIVADRCLYGVDKNPLAVEMGKLSLWLITLAKDRPFTFLDHALKCGDSLVGADEDLFVRWAHGYQDSGATLTLFDKTLRDQLTLAREKRRALAAFEVRSVRDAERKAALLREADAATARLQLGCDLLIGVRLLGLKPKEQEKRLNSLLFEYMANTEVQSAAATEALAAARRVNAFHWFAEFPEVFGGKGETGDGRLETGAKRETGDWRLETGGFSAFVGNPPFVGGKRLSTMSGEVYALYLRDTYETHNTADLVAYFFLRAFQFAKRNGTFGFIATNTIAQGDTRESGLDKIIKQGGTIYTASPSTPWPGVAAVYVAVVHIFKGLFAGKKLLDVKEVATISTLLDDTDNISGNPKLLVANAEKSFIGVFVRGMGFVLDPGEAQTLIAKNPKNAEVIRPYLNGEDLNTHPKQMYSRWVINFSNWPIEQAREYPDCLAIIKERIYPERMGDSESQKIYEKIWWQFWRPRLELYRTIAPLQQVLVRTRVTKTHAPCFVSKEQVFSDATVVMAFDDYASYSLLQSSFHEHWAWTYASTLKTDLRYSPTDCFETFPFPLRAFGPSREPSPLDSLGEQYHEHRRQIMLSRQEGLTKTYNRFHNPQESSADIAELRRLHVAMDNAVAAAYGWGDLDLGHGFQDTAQGVRYTLSEPARREVLARLLKLNHERWEEEQKAEGSEKKVEKKPRKKKVGGEPYKTDQIGML